MQCDRLKKLAGDWSDQIVEDALAPARMVEFAIRHIKSCPVCQADPTVSIEQAKVRKMLVPFISARDPQKAARFEDILAIYAYAGYEEESEPEEKAPEEEEIEEETEEEEI